MKTNTRMKPPPAHRLSALPSILAVELLAAAAGACGTPAGAPSSTTGGGPQGQGQSVDASQAASDAGGTSSDTAANGPDGSLLETGALPDGGGPYDGSDIADGASEVAPLATGSFPFQPAFILGADISWETQHEAQGYTYSDGTSTKTMVAIMAENGFNYIRLRTFVDPSASDGYSPGQNWCGQADTVTMAKRAKACGLGVLVDFQMSDSWESLGTNGTASTMALAWRTLSQTVPPTPVSASTHYTNNLYQAAHDYVASVMRALVAAGAKPDMVQIGNETNTGMGGVPMSNWPAFSAFVNAGITAVRETDPRIIVWAQNGRPRPNSAGGDNFTGWVDDYLSDKAPYVPAIDEDGICGSTYGTTDNGADWSTCFSYVFTTYKKPVMSCEYTNTSPDNNAGAVINALMHGFPGHMGRGSFVWEPADYPSAGPNVTGTLFGLVGKVYTTNAAMGAYPKLAKSYGLPVPASTTCGH